MVLITAAADSMSASAAWAKRAESMRMDMAFYMRHAWRHLEAEKAYAVSFGGSVVYSSFK